MKSYECERCKTIYYSIRAIMIDDGHHLVCDKCEKLFEVEYEVFVDKFLCSDEARKDNG